MIKESKKKIYVTSDYDAFKLLTGNREIRRLRVNNAIESIQKFGWLTQPILVNENMEIIDGQGRFCALKELGMPVEFVIDSGIGVDECIGMNLHQKNWSTRDYIKSFAAKGNVDYSWLDSLFKSYNKLSSNVIVSSSLSSGKLAYMKMDELGKIKNGTFHISDRDKIRVEEMLSYLSEFAEVANHIGGRTDTFFSALSFCFNHDAIDNKRMLKVITNGRYEIISGGSNEAYISQFDELYNRNKSKQHRVDIVHEYKVR